MSRFTQCDQCKKQVRGYPQSHSGWVVVHDPISYYDKTDRMDWENGPAFCSQTCLAAWALERVEKERRGEAEQEERRRKAELANVRP